MSYENLNDKKVLQQIVDEYQDRFGIKPTPNCVCTFDEDTKDEWIGVQVCDLAIDGMVPADLLIVIAGLSNIQNKKGITKDYLSFDDDLFIGGYSIREVLDIKNQTK